MNEESQIEEMRAALRGERERAEQARQRSTENVLEPIIRAPAEPIPEAESQLPPRRSLLSRLLGR